MSRRRIPEPLYTYKQIERVLANSRQRMVKDLQDLGILLRGKKMSLREIGDWFRCSDVNVFDMLHHRPGRRRGRPRKKSKKLKRT